MLKIRRQLIDVRGSKLTAGSFEKRRAIGPNRITAHLHQKRLHRSGIKSVWRVPHYLTESRAQRNALAVWTREHIVTIDDSGIDARPGR